MKQSSLAAPGERVEEELQKSRREWKMKQSSLAAPGERGEEELQKEKRREWKNKQS